MKGLIATAVSAITCHSALDAQLSRQQIEQQTHASNKRDHYLGTEPTTLSTYVFCPVIFPGCLAPLCKRGERLVFANALSQSLSLWLNCR
jgi:hypothetical protein